LDSWPFLIALMRTGLASPFSNSVISYNFAALRMRWTGLGCALAKRPLRDGEDFGCGEDWGGKYRRCFSPSPLASVRTPRFSRSSILSGIGAGLNHHANLSHRFAPYPSGMPGARGTASKPPEPMVRWPDGPIGRAEGECREAACVEDGGGGGASPHWILQMPQTTMSRSLGLLLQRIRGVLSPRNSQTCPGPMAWVRHRLLT
jgi:hypothetical protein